MGRFLLSSLHLQVVHRNNYLKIYVQILNGKAVYLVFHF